ncbi:ABC transporter permease [uncultured Jatrophihabitans sp.]|uniref:ABC transporter permease n=1 Tax=uncultured Jatrophihabitans sp. TaxID=1610747 RepID=UPI0035CB8321
MNATYLRFEFARLFRNRQNFIFSLIFPLVLFFAIAGPNRNKTVVDDITFSRFYMAGMIAFGTLAAVLAGGARIAMERQIGWNRQLRLTPLSPRAYLRTKVLTSYLLAVISLLLITGSALALGARFPMVDWLKGVGLVLIALIPFAALGVLLGHLIKGDSMGPVIGGSMSVFIILGGGYFPIGTGHGFMHYFVRLIPSFWLVQAGKTGLGGQEWTSEAWLVVAVWAVALAAAAVWAYRRDTQRA